MQNNPEKLKAAIYYRISKKARNDIRMQRKICRKYCLKQKINIACEYIDRGFSGRTKNRPALNKLLEEAESNKFNCVVVYKVDRLGRKFLHFNNFIEHFEKKRIRIISATQNFDNFTPEGKFMLRMLTILAEFESEMISKRIIDGLRSSKK